MLIIAFGHKKFSGKDSAAKFLFSDLTIKYPNKVIIKRGFADKLKDISHTLFAWAGIKPKEYYDIYPDQKETYLPAINKTVRQVWIDVGMKMREIYQDIWIDYLLKGLSQQGTDILLISDLRFPNEFDKIKQMGGYCVRIDRNNDVKQDMLKEKSRINFQIKDVADDALDGYIEKWDSIIDNNHTLKEFYLDLIHKLHPILKSI